MISQNDYLILQSIISSDDKDKGIIPSKGTTKKEIMEKTKLSHSKVTNTLYYFIEKGFIEEGLKVRNGKAYIFTKIGLREYLKLKGVEVEEE